MVPQLESDAWNFVKPEGSVLSGEDIVRRFNEDPFIVACRVVDPRKIGLDVRVLLLEPRLGDDRDTRSECVSVKIGMLEKLEAVSIGPCADGNLLGEFLSAGLGGRMIFTAEDDKGCRVIIRSFSTGRNQGFERIMVWGENKGNPCWVNAEEGLQERYERGVVIVPKENYAGHSKAPKASIFLFPLDKVIEGGDRFNEMVKESERMVSLNI